ncbi:class I SAM-dependent methyltransferase [Leucobacter aridicollis]|uniref:Demethylmenaquinone methyltransferase n=1 Tax=Leucobacter aridicollis TaxID=283878 RepID=A0A852R0Q6_9MICO|nr:class I SAM-dependent methyltransferase [Leucobacter aridicollis]NYD25255.1 demethylmenaquinone methyltransferase/2-methoxy-6-polyprenyl-1,4-benzoquinol methylase [Leucobacter aridicollis]
MTRPDTTTKHGTDVSAMFDEVSPKYDLLNDVLSAGNSRLWRIATTRAIGPRKGMRILDLAAGTGTSSAALAAHGAHVTAADFSEGMLAEGRRRNAGNDLIDFVWADATQLPFEDDSFDAATISYGLRNVSDPKQALAEMARVVKPGGRVVIAEFSRPSSEAVNWAYTKYNRHVLPRVAGLINRDAAEAYKYLNESIEEWPAQEELARWLREAGLERVAYRNLTLGIVALHRGFVPRAKPAAPATKDQGADKPAAKASAATKPATQAAAAKAAAPKSATKKADASKPDAAKSAAKKPATKKPAAKKPTTKSTAKASADKKPAAKKPATKKPAANTDTTAKPTPKSETNERGHE